MVLVAQYHRPTLLVRYDGDDVCETVMSIFNFSGAKIGHDDYRPNFYFVIIFKIV